MGGTAFNAAMIAAKLQVSVDIYSAVGESFKEFVEKLRRNGVGTEGVIFGVDDGNEQIAAIYQGPMDNVRWRSFGKAEWTHFCTGYPESYLEVAEKVRGKIALDPGQEVFYKYDKGILQKLMKYADLLFCNKNEYDSILKLVGEPEIRIVLTLGREGARLIHRNEEISIPAKRVDNVVRTVGAGDSFRAGFYCALMHGKSFEDAVRLANEVASRYICGDIIIN